MENSPTPKPRWSDIDLTIDQLTDGISYHWEAFYSQHPLERTSDEKTYDALFLATLSEMGVIDRDAAESIIENAKTLATQRLCKFDEELARLTSRAL